MSRLCSSDADAEAPASAARQQFLAALTEERFDLHGEARTSWVPLGNSTAPGHNTLRWRSRSIGAPGERIAIASGADHSLLEERSIEMSVRLPYRSPGKPSLASAPRQACAAAARATRVDWQSRAAVAQYRDRRMRIPNATASGPTA